MPAVEIMTVSLTFLKSKCLIIHWSLIIRAKEKEHVLQQLDMKNSYVHRVINGSYNNAELVVRIGCALVVIAENKTCQ